MNLSISIVKTNNFLPKKEFFLGTLLTLLIGCSSNPTVLPEQEFAAHQVDDLFIVDCLLPGQIRRMGQSMTYLTARRPIKTNASDCRIKGGEYVAYDRANYATALKIWLPRAQQNDPEAQVYVGEIYEKGYGLEPDYALAATWYKKAAQQGSSRAQINLGYLYESGLGVEKDLVTALNWYKKASGLESQDLAFASTIETAVRSEYEQEMDLLRNELARNQSEIKTLRSTLKNTNKQLTRGKNKLNRVRSELQKSQQQFDQLQQAPVPNQNKLNLQKQELLIREANLTKQYMEVQQLEKDYQQQNEYLSNKLLQAENRTAQLNQDLSKQQQETGQLTQKIATLQVQLKQSNQSLQKVTREFETGQQNIKKEKQALSRLKQQTNREQSAEFKKIKQQLAASDQQLAAEYTKIKQLEQEKARIIAEKNSLVENQSRNITEKNQALEKLSQQFNEQTNALQKQQLQISQLEQEKKQIEQSKNLLQQQKGQQNSQNSQQIKDLENKLAKREQNNQDLRRQMQQLEKEKQAFEKELQQVKLSKVEKVALAAPSIEILEPPFTVTRSSSMPTVKLRSVVKQREVTGRVTAPGGLLSLNINGHKEAVNESGVFSSMIKLQGKETVVDAVAIDKKGKKTALQFMLLAAAEAKTETTQESTTNQKKPRKGRYHEIDFGPYHALIIGNQQYTEGLPQLETPINDARAVEKVLKQKYGFNTTLILNANRYTILSELNKLRAKLTDVDNLLIYYAGHGELDRVNFRGYWLPIDAEPNNNANWVSTVAITDIINAMSAKHILVVADSCYSGVMTRSSLARLEPNINESLKLKWLKTMTKLHSRTVLTSGGLKPVLDNAINGHSIFANAFLEALSKNEGLLEGQALFRNISAHVRKTTERLDFPQVPEYAPIRHSGHESGDFFFRDDTTS